ncbi:MAG: acyl carrier protein [Gammaproteobacteria bacterium]|nr:acyl carrier protein [Gammaproteobacteria bacterium]MDH5594473.1 acyl carrier protein [Gammaproteobacteria bacterium]MDH5614023.1 acyl carrier protein [Gammaproteobacteria bacterium]
MFEEVRDLIGSVLQLGDRVNTITNETPLLGNLPELDSMAVVTVITSLEEHYGFFVEDDEISADTFSTMGSLVEFVEQKVKG